MRLFSLWAHSRTQLIQYNIASITRDLFVIGHANPHMQQTTDIEHAEITACCSVVGGFCCKVMNDACEAMCNGLDGLEPCSEDKATLASSSTASPAEEQAVQIRLQLQC